MSVPQRYGITFPFDGIPLLGQRELVRELVDLGYTDLWSAESGGYDAFIPLAVAAQWAPRAPARHHDRSGVHTRRAHPRVDRRVHVPGRARAVRARPRHLVERDRRALERHDVRQAVPTGARHDPVPARRAHERREGTRTYETFAVNGFRLGITVPEQPPILVAALRQGMLRLAGREGDGAIVNWLSADDVKTVAPHVGPDKEIAARIFVLPSDDPGLVYAVGKRAIASYLTVPVYAAFHEWLGRGEQLADLWRLWKEGDRKAAAESIPNEVVDQLLVWGKPEQCREHIQRYIDNGVTTPAPALFCGPDELPAALTRFVVESHIFYAFLTMSRIQQGRARRSGRTRFPSSVLER